MEVIGFTYIVSTMYNEIVSSQTLPLTLTDYQEANTSKMTYSMGLGIPALLRILVMKE